ncbi:hypothetical protein RRG08_064696 [Elysia crispata]|uniref:Uncharacterized protein n=1 Tax=Elysia crispata TaxID=231223 RepID=A0AAE0YZK9_9GAST|nr:hypothetical protein RRG08_064696 [Elysia crispata]
MSHLHSTSSLSTNITILLHVTKVPDFLPSLNTFRSTGTFDYGEEIMMAVVINKSIHTIFDVLAFESLPRWVPSIFTKASVIVPLYKPKQQSKLGSLKCNIVQNASTVLGLLCSVHLLFRCLGILDLNCIPSGQPVNALKYSCPLCDWSTRRHKLHVGNRCSLLPRDRWKGAHKRFHMRV